MGAVTALGGVSVAAPNAQSGLVADVQYFEQFGSSALNRKAYGIFAAGVYRGFTVSPAKNLEVTVNTDGENPGVASINVGNFQITVQLLTSQTITLTAGKQNFVILETVYGQGILTRQVDSSATQEAATLRVVYAENDIPTNAIEIARVNVPANAETITEAQIDITKRYQYRVSYEPTDNSNDSRESRLLTVKAGKSFLSHKGGTVDGPLTVTGKTTIESFAGQPITLTGTSPSLLFDETDTGKQYWIVSDGGSIRLQEDSTAGTSVWAWVQATQTLRTDGSFQCGRIKATGEINTDSTVEANFKGNYAYAKQYEEKAAFYNELVGGRSDYHPVIKQKVTNSGGSWVFSMGALSSEPSTSFSFHIINSEGLSFNHQFNTSGDFNVDRQLIPGSYDNFDARYSNKGQTEGKYISSIRLGGKTTVGTTGGVVTVNAPNGYVFVGRSSSNGDVRYQLWYIRPIQYYINGTWYTAAAA